MSTGDEHVSTLRNDAAGWWVIGCSCSTLSEVVPDPGTAVDVYGDHAYAVGYRDGKAGSTHQAPNVVTDAGGGA
jgi:hypothetical protein